MSCSGRPREHRARGIKDAHVAAAIPEVQSYGQSIGLHEAAHCSPAYSVLLVRHLSGVSSLGVRVPVDIRNLVRARDGWLLSNRALEPWPNQRKTISTLVDWGE